MVHCTSCGEEHDDSHSICRTCGTDLPEADLMIMLREEARQIRLHNGQARQLSDTERENLATMHKLNQKSNEDVTDAQPQQNGDHVHTARENTESLRFLMQSMGD